MSPVQYQDYACWGIHLYWKESR